MQKSIRMRVEQVSQDLILDIAASFLEPGLNSPWISSFPIPDLAFDEMWDSSQISLNSIADLGF
jgi:hypothetical protein